MVQKLFTDDYHLLWDANRYRPCYHFLPPKNWMNDPNGLIQWQGQYHLFYQHNPDNPFWANMHWGHAVSTDLVHWNHLPIAMAPTPGGPDADGCWSGCAVNDNGTPTFIYSGHQEGRCQLPCLAIGSPDLLTLYKYPGNPIISAPPPELDLVAFRDHSVWREGDTWYQLIGAGIRNVGGTALLYRSPDLRQWEYLNPILIGDINQTEPVWTGPIWECPDFFALGDKHILLISVHDGRALYPIYFIGTYTNHQFTPELLRKPDFGDDLFYAPQTMLDDQGRRLMRGWIQESRSRAAQVAAGWAGVMSLPRVLSLHPTGCLGLEPAPELQVLRGQHYHQANITLTPASANLLPDIRGDSLEIQIELTPGEAKRCGLKIYCSPDGLEETLIFYDRETGCLTLDRSRSSLDETVDRSPRQGPLTLAADEPLQLHIFLDHSVIEIFANGRACLTGRVYPSRADSLGLDLFTWGGPAPVVSLDIWKMNSIKISGTHWDLP
ncbi:MAG: glycoside hydrolase family 32 protein [Chloroflexota bacterium]